MFDLKFCVTVFCVKTLYSGYILLYVGLFIRLLNKAVAGMEMFLSIYRLHNLTVDTYDTKIELFSGNLTWIWCSVDAPHQAYLAYQYESLVMWW
jgi:hypothetical protein